MSARRDRVLDFLAASDPRPPDNADPHPVILHVDPRFIDEHGCEHEAYLDVEIEHPDTCPGEPSLCPVQDYLDVIGPDREFTKAFPEPDFLTVEELAALDGTVRYVTITRNCATYSNGPSGVEYEVEYDFTWSDL